MAQARLRIYYGDNEEAGTPVLGAAKKAENTVSVPLREILPILSDAQGSNRTWLSDFDDDEITISSDLYEVLMAYQHYTKASA